MSEAIEASLREILSELRALRQAIAPAPMLLSKREASRRLGVSRGRTLDVLISQGRVKPVRVGGRLKVPLAEVERIAREGSEEPKRASRTTTRYITAKVRDALRARGF